MHEVMSAVDRPLRNNHLGIRLCVSDRVGGHYAIARHRFATALPAPSGPAVGSRDHHHCRWAAATVTGASNSAQRPCFTEPHRKATITSSPRGQVFRVGTRERSVRWKAVKSYGTC